MVRCPLCEHEQPSGEQCEVCGRRLASSAGAALEVPAIEGLEPTSHAAVDADSEPIEAFEPNAIGALAIDGALPADPLALPVDGAPADPPQAWVERTAQDPVAAPQAAALSDVEPTAHASPPPPPHDPFALAVCRYCRTPAAPGDVFCERCGMKLAIYHRAGGPAQEGG
jgi:hypothetical protein